MDKPSKMQLIRDTGVIAIMRAQRSDHLIAAADAIRKGGVRVIEVTMTTPGALDTITKAVTKYGDDVLFGAGSVLDSETARMAILAGAGFIVAPTLDIPTISLCNQYSIPVMPGCYTPTEILAAWRAGADMVKLFPASVGGPNLVKAIRAPIPQVDIVPVGGVDQNNATAFISHGAAAIGVGGCLVNQKLLDAGNFPELQHRAEALRAAVEEGRS